MDVLSVRFGLRFFRSEGAPPTKSYKSGALVLLWEARPRGE